MVSVLSERVTPGDIVQVQPHAVIPCDGHLLERNATISNAHITGESRAITLHPGDTLLAGGLNLGGLIRMETVAVGPNTRIGKVLEMAERTSTADLPFRDVTERLSTYFIATVLSLCALTFWLWLPVGIEPAIANTIALLVVSCPCAIGLSGPIATAVAVARATQKGIFIRRSHIFEQMNSITHCVFDKTGTLTSGNCAVQEHRLFGTPTDVFELIQQLEQNTTHPVGVALRQFARTQLPNSLPTSPLSDMLEVAASGCAGKTNGGQEIRLGTIAWACEGLLSIPPEAEMFIAASRQAGQSPVALTKAGDLLAVFALGDTLIPGMGEFLGRLDKSGLRISIISGDEQSVVTHLSKTLPCTPATVLGGQSPEQKASFVRQLAASETVLMIGDGINDVLALSEAAASIAVRGRVESCLQVADMFVPSGRADLLESCFTASKSTMATIKNNIGLSLLYNTVGIVLAMNGLLTPLLAAVVMPLSSLSVVLSSAKNKAFQ
jgi:Cu2+-exporting ATPase